MLKSIVTGAALLFAVVPAAAVVIPSNQSTSTVIASVMSGQSYTVTISGFSTLCLTCNGGGALTFDSNGRPIATPVGGYAPFAPNGRDEDPSTAGTDYGTAGAGFNLGSLVFTMANGSGNPVGGFFTLQNGGTFTAGRTGTLNAFVNDTNYSDNASTGFTVTLSALQAGAVPEPASWAMMIAGFGLAGVAMRRTPRRTILA